MVVPPLTRLRFLPTSTRRLRAGLTSFRRCAAGSVAFRAMSSIKRSASRLRQSFYNSAEVLSINRSVARHHFVTVTIAVADFPESALLVAVTWYVPGAFGAM